MIRVLKEIEVKKCQEVIKLIIEGGVKLGGLSMSIVITR